MLLSCCPIITNHGAAPFKTNALLELSLRSSVTFSVRRLIKLALDGYGYAVLVAENVKEGFKIFQARADSIILVVSDIVMPETNGKDLFLKVRGLTRSVPFLFISGHFNPIQDTVFSSKEDFNLLEKPFSPSESAAKIAAILRKDPI